VGGGAGGGGGGGVGGGQGGGEKGGGGGVKIGLSMLELLRRACKRWRGVAARERYIHESKPIAQSGGERKDTQGGAGRGTMRMAKQYLH